MGHYSVFETHFSFLRTLSTFQSFRTLIGQYRSRDLDTGLWLVNTDHVTWILASDWSELGLVMRLEGDPRAAIDRRIPQPVTRVLPDDGAVMTMGAAHLVTRGHGHTHPALPQQPRPVTEAPAAVHLLPAGQTPGAAIGQT